LKTQADVQYLTYAKFQELVPTSAISPGLGGTAYANSTELGAGFVRECIEDISLARMKDVNERLHAGWAAQNVNASADWPVTAVRFEVVQQSAAPQVHMDVSLEITRAWCVTVETAFTMPADVKPFVKKWGLERDFSYVEELIIDVFASPATVAVELVASPEDDTEGGERLVFTISSDLARQAFRRATQAFYAKLRSSGLQIYPLITILRGL
jgi:hypothetical protein